MHEDNVHCASEASDDEYDAGENWVLLTRRAAGDHDGKDQWRVEADQANVMMKQLSC